MGATEIAYLPLKAGSNIHDPNTPEGTIWQECATTVLGVDGNQRIFWGTGHEDASMLYLFVDWDNVEAHQKFIDSREYQPFVTNLGKIMSGPPKLYHVHLTPHPATAALSDTSAPVTELVSWYIDPSTSDTSKVESDIKKFVSLVEEHPEGYKGSAGGWSVEEVESPKTGKKCKVYTLVMGWESVEAHMKMREQQWAKDNMHYVMDVPGLEEINGIHVKLQEQTGGAAGGLGGEERGALATNPQEEVLNPHQQSQAPPKTKADGTTVKHNDALKGAANEVHKERAGRGPYHHSVNHGN